MSNSETWQTQQESAIDDILYRTAYEYFNGIVDFNTAITVIRTIRELFYAPLDSDMSYYPSDMQQAINGYIDKIEGDICLHHHTSKAETEEKMRQIWNKGGFKPQLVLETTKRQPDAYYKKLEYRRYP